MISKSEYDVLEYFRVCKTALDVLKQIEKDLLGSATLWLQKVEVQRQHKDWAGQVGLSPKVKRWQRQGLMFPK